MQVRKLIWPTIGLAALCVSGWLLYHEVRGISADDVREGLAAIPAWNWTLAALSSIVAYLALAGYDQIALNHIGRHVSWPFVALCSFTTYALSHNIGGSVFSGAVIRYRAYATRGLGAKEVGVLVGLCWLTFVLSTILVTGVVFILSPGLLDRWVDLAGPWAVRGAGLFGVAIVAAYVFGSWLRLPPLRLGGFELQYPKLPIVVRQLLIGPVELLAAAGIIYFALPAAADLGYLTVLGVFLVAFSAAQVSHAPGGLGVFEVVFLNGLSALDPAAVLAALLAFRLLYLVLPLILAILVVLVFERGQFVGGGSNNSEDPASPPPGGRHVRSGLD